MAFRTEDFADCLSEIQDVVTFQSEEYEPLLQQKYEEVIKNQHQVSVSTQKEKYCSRKLERENMNTTAKIEEYGSKMDAISKMFIQDKEKITLLDEQVKGIRDQKELMQTQYEKILRDLSTRFRNAVNDYNSDKLQNEIELMTSKSEEATNTLDNFNTEWNMLYQQFYMSDDSLNAIKEIMKNAADDENWISLLTLKEKELDNIETQLAQEISDLNAKIINQEKKSQK